MHILSCTFEAVNCIKKACLLERSQTLRLSPHASKARTHSTQNASTKSITAVTDRAFVPSLDQCTVLVISATKNVVSLPRTQGHWGRLVSVVFHSWDLAGLRISAPAQSRFSASSNGLPHASISEQQTAWVVGVHLGFVSRHNSIIHGAKLYYKLEEKKQGVERA
jgi:hypothetical protein